MANASRSVLLPFFLHLSLSLLLASQIKVCLSACLTANPAAASRHLLQSNWKVFTSAQSLILSCSFVCPVCPSCPACPSALLSTNWQSNSSRFGDIRASKQERIWGATMWTCSACLGSLFIYSKIVFPLLLNWAIYNEALDAAAAAAADALPTPSTGRQSPGWCLRLRHVITLAACSDLYACVCVVECMCVCPLAGPQQ